MNDKKSLQHLSSLAQTGDPHAQFEMGRRYQFGKEVETDMDKALSFYKQAAAKGLAEAQYHLGMIYCVGQDVSKSYLQALKYLRLAANQGHALAQYNLGVIYAAGHGVAKDKIAAYALFKLSQKNGNPKQFKLTASAEEMAQIDALLEALQTSDNLIQALEKYQMQFQQQKMAIASVMWQSHVNTHATKRRRGDKGISLPYFKIALVMSFAIWFLTRMLPDTSDSNLSKAASLAPQSNNENLCVGPPITNPQALTAAREEAATEGYAINETLHCIDRPSFEMMQANKRAYEKHHAEELVAKRQKLAVRGQSELVQARLEFKTAIHVKDSTPLPLPLPPADLFRRNDYKNPQHHWMPGFVSPDPRDGQRHPAIIWLTGGDTNSLSDFWTPGPAANDQSARAFREAGMIMYFPTLRGGNGEEQGKEFFLGEVDDVLAAAEQLAKLTYVDPEQIYLGGHSTGGTLALLTAAMKTPFKAIFAFGPIDQVERYPHALLPVRFSDYAENELKLRSPLYWLSGIDKPTYVIEGATGTNNSAALEALCAATDNPKLQCIRVQNADHFSVLLGATQKIAAKIVTKPVDELTLTAEEFN